MRLRNLAIGAVVTAAMLGAAIVALDRQRQPGALATGTEPALPKLAAGLNEAAELVIQDAKGIFTIRKQGEGWMFVERDGYATPFDRVKTALVGLADLKLLEAKTADPKYFERLQLDDPTKSKNSKAMLVTVKTAAGEVLGATYVGRRNFDLYGKRGGGTYIRRQGEEQTWLAEGDLNISLVASDWTERAIVDLPEKEVRRVALTQPDGKTVVISKAAATDPDFTIEKLPKGREVKSKSDVSQIGRAMADLKLEDVKKADRIAFDKDVHRAQFTTFDGVTVRAELVKQNLEYWARFAAESAAPAAEQRAAAINARVKGWAYRLSLANGDDLTRKLNDLLKDEKGS